jgi:Domain of unknown function (DUF1844)
MSDVSSEQEYGSISQEEHFSMLFAQLVMQQSNMAMMFMGKVAHPQKGEVVQDFESARLFIDQLEMLEAKTKGNLSKDEESLLKQTLMTLRLTFVESIESRTSEAAPRTSEASGRPEPAASSESSGGEQGAGASEEEHRKKFTKKY